MSAPHLSSITPDEHYRHAHRRFALVCLIAITSVSLGVGILQHLLWSFLRPVYLQALSRDMFGTCGRSGSFQYANCVAPEAGIVDIGHRFVLLFCVSIGVLLLAYMYEQRYSRNTEVASWLDNRIRTIGNPVIALFVLAAVVSLIILLVSTSFALIDAML